MEQWGGGDGEGPSKSNQMCGGREICHPMRFESIVRSSMIDGRPLPILATRPSALSAPFCCVWCWISFVVCLFVFFLRINPPLFLILPFSFLEGTHLFAHLLKKKYKLGLGQLTYSSSNWLARFCFLGDLLFFWKFESDDSNENNSRWFFQMSNFIGFSWSLKMVNFTKCRLQKKHRTQKSMQ